MRQRKGGATRRHLIDAFDVASFFIEKTRKFPGRLQSRVSQDLTLSGPFVENFESQGGIPLNSY